MTFWFLFLFCLISCPVQTRHSCYFRNSENFTCTCTVFKSDTTLSTRLNRMVSLQDSLRVRQTLHQRNREIYAGEDQRARQGCTIHLYRDLRRFWTRLRDRPRAYLERGYVYWLGSHWDTRRVTQATHIRLKLNKINRDRCPRSKIRNKRAVQ